MKNDEKIHIPKPVVKWVGGKTQIIDQVITSFPKEMSSYHEIFLGGGSVLLALLSHVKAGNIKIHENIHVYDLNEVLIYMYKNIQSNHDELYDTLQDIIKEFKECGDGKINRKASSKEEAKTSKENYYYWTRKRYNNLSRVEKKSLLGSSLFIFLNKTCFRGIFREGPRGFNVPYGHYKNPEIVNKCHLEEIHQLIQGVMFECSDFEVSLSNINDVDDFVYLDPPYAPETKTSFVGYTKDGFSIENHQKLFKLIHDLTSNGKRILLSNSDVKLVSENFIDEKYNKKTIQCKRSINSKKPNSKTKEVLIKNY